jgi:hypothetical protein
MSNFPINSFTPIHRNVALTQPQAVRRPPADLIAPVEEQDDDGLVDHYDPNEERHETEDHAQPHDQPAAEPAAEDAITVQAEDAPDASITTVPPAPHKPMPKLFSLHPSVIPATEHLDISA